MWVLVMIGLFADGNYEIRLLPASNVKDCLQAQEIVMARAEIKGVTDYVAADCVFMEMK